VSAKPNPESDKDRSFVITRDFNAPARVLFEAYGKPEHLMQWFGPKDYPLTMCEVDFRVGGKYRFAMTGPSGTQNPPFGGTYLEIEPYRLIRFDNAFELPGSGRMIMTVTFDEQGGKTKLTLHTLFDSVAMRNEYLGLGFDLGTNSAFDQLVDVVAKIQGGAG
jgi:uncharacterized protein YndB with AHSA1/START domain